MSASNQFDWVDFYKELSGKLLQYKNNRKELVLKVRKKYDFLKGSGVFFLHLMNYLSLHDIS